MEYYTLGWDRPKFPATWFHFRVARDTIIKGECTVQYLQYLSWSYKVGDEIRHHHTLIRNHSPSSPWWAIATGIGYVEIESVCCCCCSGVCLVCNVDGTHVVAMSFQVESDYTLTTICGVGHDMFCLQSSLWTLTMATGYLHRTRLLAYAGCFPHRYPRNPT